jgi:hypothetical protein
MNNRQVGHSKLQMSSTQIQAVTLIKPGGTLLVAQESLKEEMMIWKDGALFG